MKIKSNHLLALLRLVLRIGLRRIGFRHIGLRLVLRDFLAPPPGAELAFGDIAALGDFAALGDIAASSAAHLWQINSSCSPSPRVA